MASRHLRCMPAFLLLRQTPFPLNEIRAFGPIEKKIDAWTAELAYYARHGVSSQRRVQELDVSLWHLFAL
jgi:hypothetical protein